MPEEVKTENKQVKEKLPIAIFYYILYLVVMIPVWVQLFSLQGNISVIISAIISAVSYVYMIVVLFRRKKDIHLFVAAALPVLGNIAGVFTGITIYKLFGFIESALMIFIVGTVALPQLEAHREKAKKLFFLPALVAFAVNVLIMLPNFSSMFNFSNLSDLTYRIMSLFGVPFMYYLVCSWCMERDKNKLSLLTGPEKFFFKVVAVLLAAMIIIPYIPTSGGSDKSCQSCGREFSDSDNKKSISRTNMCENCYNNYKSLEWVLE